MILAISQRKQIYDEYMRSPEWADKRRLYKKSQCEMYSSRSQLTLHHLTYKNLKNETEDDLATLCWTCHRAFHIHMKTGKRLKKPSTGMAKILRRIRNGRRIGFNKTADFLRRRFIIEHGTSNLPKFKKFQKIAIHRKPIGGLNGMGSVHR